MRRLVFNNFQGLRTWIPVFTGMTHVFWDALRNMTPELLRSATSKIAFLQGKIGAEHLQTHLEQKALLTDEQVGKYKVLRGYSNRISK
jgi:hypothetical protein